MNKLQLKFRNAMRGDLNDIVSIYNSTIPSRMVTADTETVRVESRMEWYREHDPKRRPLLVALHEDQIIGWISFQDFYGRPAYQHTAEISLYLHEDFRGKGLGKDLLQYSMDRAPSLGITNLMGFIFSHNEPSLRLFQKFGFEKWGYFPNIAVLDGQYRSLQILGKKLEEPV